MAEIQLDNSDSKKSVFNKVEMYLGELAIGVSSIDSKRPWGGFFVIDETQTDKFIETYFPDYPKEQIAQYGGKLSPKILIVQPEQRLSWQYHNRRAELWRVVQGPVGVITSPSDKQGKVRALQTGETVQFDQGIRHRLIGLNSWGVVAEIWQHTNLAQPSDESDIIRIEDDYGR
jgi:mannose-6-phosphate isomerase-like protein (cupin superfamily)